MGVLASVAWPLAELEGKRSREAELRLALREIRSAIDAYRRAVDEGRIDSPPGASGYPPNLDVLVLGVVDRTAANGQRIYFLRSLPADPMSSDNDPEPIGRDGQALRNAAQTWVLRSYASPPNDPKPGADVFDVHSRAGGVGLNGRHYRDW